MSSEKIVKKIDKSRRLVLSADIRQIFPVDRGQKVSLELDERNNRIILAKLENDSENGSGASENA